MTEPTISAVVTAYNAEAFLAESLQAILGQTRPPNEVVVVDDGSTDATAAILERFGSALRVVRQPNRGHAAALNRGFAEAQGDFLAKCDADDVWEPGKLERQLDAVSRHPEIDVAFGAVQVFGDSDELWGLDDPDAGPGVLDRDRFVASLYEANSICPSSTLISRRAYEALGPFDEHLPAEDYDYWFRALRAGCTFYYDPTVLLRYRRHEAQITDDLLRLHRSLLQVRTLHADLVAPDLARSVRVRGRFKTARALVDANRPAEARDLFGQCLRDARGAVPAATVRALAWIALLSLPGRAREHLSGSLVHASRAWEGVRGGRHPALP